MSLQAASVPNGSNACSISFRRLAIAVDCTKKIVKPNYSHNEKLQSFKKKQYCFGVQSHQP